MHKKFPLKFKQSVQEVRIQTNAQYERELLDEYKKASRVSLMRSHHSDLHLNRYLTQRLEIEEYAAQKKK